MNRERGFVVRKYRGKDIVVTGAEYWVKIDGIDGGCVFNRQKELLGICRVCAGGMMRPPAGSEMEIFTKVIGSILFPGSVPSKIPDQALSPYSAVDTLELLRKYVLDFSEKPPIQEVNILPLLQKVQDIEQIEEIRKILRCYEACFTEEHFMHINPAFVWYMIAQGVPCTFNVYHAFLTRVYTRPGNVPRFCEWCVEHLAFTPAQYLLALELEKANRLLLLEKMFEHAKETDYTEQEIIRMIKCATRQTEESRTILNLFQKYEWHLTKDMVLTFIENRVTVFGKEAHPFRILILRLVEWYPCYVVDIILHLIVPGGEKLAAEIIEKFPAIKDDRTFVTRLFTELELAYWERIASYIRKNGIYIDCAALKLLLDDDEEIDSDDEDYDYAKQETIKSLLEEDI